MPANSETFDITTDTELQSALRTETAYDTDILPPDDTEGLISSAKRELALKADITNFYDDRGTAVALLGLLCAKAKGRVENQPVQVKNLGTEDVTFRTTDGSSLQLQQYEDMVQLGLSNADNTDTDTASLRLTNTHTHGTF